MSNILHYLTTSPLSRSPASSSPSQSGENTPPQQHATRKTAAATVTGTNGLTVTAISHAHRARQQFSFSELVGIDLTLLLEEQLLIRIFGALTYSDRFVAKRVCSRWKPLCESKSIYADLDMQSFIHYSRYLPRAVLNGFITSLSMDSDEIYALKMDSIKVWIEDVIPTWEKKKSTKKVRELILQGIPSHVRSKVWPLLVGNDLNITPELFSIFGARAERAKQKGDASLGREGTVTLIHLDLPRTFPMLSIFQDEGPLHQSLANVLEAYVCYRPDVGYVQGMSYLAAVFLLILDEYSAFVCLANFLNNPCYMAFYTMNLTQMEVYMKAMDSLMCTHLPKVHRHLKELGIQPDIFMIDWVLTIFSKALPLDVASHVWDNLFVEGELFIFQVALGVLKMYSKELEGGDFDLCMTLLTHLPPDIDDDELFQHINSFTINAKLFSKMVENAQSRSEVDFGTKTEDCMSMRIWICTLNQTIPNADFYGLMWC
eukprot:gene8376-9845_t